MNRNTKKSVRFADEESQSEEYQSSGEEHNSSDEGSEVEPEPPRRFKRPGESSKPRKMVKTASKKNIPIPKTFTLNLDKIAEQMKGSKDPNFAEEIKRSKEKFAFNHRVWEIMDQYKTVGEVEFRFGLRSSDGSRFSPGISKRAFEILQIILEDRELEKTLSSDTVEIYKNKGKSIRKITRDGIVSWQEKIQKSFYEDSFLGFKIVSSHENDLPAQKVEGNPYVRERKRITFNCLDTGSPYYGFKVEFTDTDDALIEMEIEMVRESFRKKYSRVEECSSSLEEIFEDIFIGISQSSIYRLYADERRGVISEVNAYFGADRSTPDNGCILPFINKPINLGEREYYTSKSNWYITEKTDGVRYLLYINNNGSYLLQEPRSIQKISDLVDLIAPLPILLEVELTKNSDDISVLTIFDVLVMGKAVWREPFSRYNKIFAEDPETRVPVMNILSHLIKHNKLSAKGMGEPTGYTLKAKTFYHPDPKETASTHIIQKSFQSAFKEIRKRSEKPDSLVDGIILQDPGSYITGLSKQPTGTFKWKPASKLSIDFLVKKTEDVGIYSLHYGKGELFEGTDEYPVDSHFDMNEQPDPESYDGKIIELAWDSEYEAFVFLRVREDKNYPNGRGTVFSVWRDMREPFDPLVGSTDFRGMRIFHNQIKRTLLQTYLRKGQDLVDLGSGRGGDVGKWSEIGLNKVLAVEPDSDKKDEKHIPELKRRIKGIKNTQIFVGEYGAENYKSIKADLEHHSMKPNVFSAFFCLTFFKRGTDEYNDLLKTLSMIPEEGYFIGTVLDGKKVENIIGTEKFKQDGLTMKIKGDELSIKIEGTMVDYTEFLFDYNAFVDDMGKLGFIQEDRKYLDGALDKELFGKLTDTERFFSEMNNLFVLKKTKALVHNHIMSVGSEAIFSQDKVKEKYWMVNPYQPLEKMSFLNAVLFCLDPAYRKMFSIDPEEPSAKKDLREIFKGVKGFLAPMKKLESAVQSEKIEGKNKLIELFKGDAKTKKKAIALMDSIMNEMTDDAKIAAKTAIDRFIELAYSANGLSLENWKEKPELAKLIKEKGEKTVRKMVKDALEGDPMSSELAKYLRKVFDKGVEKKVRQFFVGKGLKGRLIANPDIFLDTVYGKILIDSYLKNHIPIEEARISAFSEFMAMYDDPNCLMTHRSMNGVLSTIYEVNILIFDKNSNLYIGKEIPPINTDHQDYIMLFTPDSEHYYPIRSSDDSYIFTIEEPLVEKITGLYEENDFEEEALE